MNLTSANCPRQEAELHNISQKKNNRKQTLCPHVDSVLFCVKFSRSCSYWGRLFGSEHKHPGTVGGNWEIFFFFFKEFSLLLISESVQVIIHLITYWSRSRSRSPPCPWSVSWRSSTAERGIEGTAISPPGASRRSADTTSTHTHLNTKPHRGRLSDRDSRWRSNQTPAVIL